MKAGAVVLGLVLMVVVPAQAQHGGGGGHSGGFGGGHSWGGHSWGGHFGGHSGGHHGHGKSGRWGSARGGHFSTSAFSHHVGPRALTSSVAFGSVPGFHFFFATDSFFCPSVPHLVSPFCHFCRPGFVGPFFGGGFFGFSDFAFFDDSWPWFGSTVSPPAVAVAPQPGALQNPRPVLVFTNGWTFEVSDYWIDDEGELRYITSYGGMNIADLQSLDLYATVKANEERRIPFTLKLRWGQ